MTKMRTNPITDEEFIDQAEYIQSLINSLAVVHKEKYNAAQDETAILEELMLDVDKEEMKSITLKGTQDAIRVKRTLRASYPRKHGSRHPLDWLLEEYGDAMADMVAIDYKERGSRISKMLKELEDGNLAPEFVDMMQAIKQLRVEKEGKPEAEIKTGKGGK